MLATQGYVSASKGAPFEAAQVTLPPLSPTEVQVDVRMMGLCHTDILMRDNSWNLSDYPLLAGHEAVCVVTHIGAACRVLKPGQRVGISWIRDSCAACPACMEGRENLCRAGYQGTYLGASASPPSGAAAAYNAHGGCFVRTQRIQERFAVPIPDPVPDHIACPLLCGGGTVYEPLCEYASPGAAVGVVGIGGLGTAAIKLGKLRGAVMYALSTSESKRSAVLACGASYFVCTANDDEVRAVTATLDLIIDTTPVKLDLDVMLAYLKPGGVYCKVGAMPADHATFSTSYLPIIFQSKRIVGSCVTGTKRLNDMLRLVADNINFMKDTDAWKADKLPITQLNQAMHSLHNRTNNGYRYILEW